MQHVEMALSLVIFSLSFVFLLGAIKKENDSAFFGWLVAIIFQAKWFIEAWWF